MARSQWLRGQVLGLPVQFTPDVLRAAEDLVNRGGQVVTLNAEMAMAALSHGQLREVIQDAELVIPDGAGVVWALGLQGHRVRRQPGIELAEMLLAHASTMGWRVAWVGAQESRLKAAAERWRKRHPNLRLEHLIHGYQAPGQWPVLEGELQRQEPELVFVGLGVPRQELWIQKVRPHGHGLWLGVGGSFDVWSGSINRAPPWFRAAQLEWLYRLLQEPQRWRRILVLPLFVGHVVMDLVRPRFSENRRRLARRRPAKGKIGESGAGCPPGEQRADRPPAAGPE